MSIDWSAVETAEDRAAAELAEAKAQAAARLREEMNARAEVFVGRYPPAERLAWPQKEAAARALLAGQRGTDATEMVDLEAAALGVDPVDLAGLIASKAAEFRAASAQLSALRQQVEAGIDAAETPQAVAAALAVLG